MSVVSRVATARTGWSAPVVLFCLGTFLFWAALYVYVPVLSVYARSRGASLALAGLVISAYGVTQLLTRVPIGFYSDRLGRRKPFVLAGLVAGAVGCLGLVVSPGPWGLVLSRAVIGVGASMWVAFSVLFASYFAANRTAQAMGVISFVNGSAQAAAGLAGGLLSDRLGPESTFYAGALLALGGLGVMAAIPERQQSRPTTMSLGRLAGIARMPLLLLAGGVSLINTLVNFTTSQTFIPIYARELGASDAQLGVLWTTSVIAFTVASLAGARAAELLSDRWVIAGSLLVSGAMTLVVPLTGDLVTLAATQVVAGLGRGLCNPILMSLSIRALPPHERASGMGVYQATYSLGMFVGPPAGGAVADALGLWSVFALTGALCGVGSVVALASRALRAEARA